MVAQFGFYMNRHMSHEVTIVPGTYLRVGRDVAIQAVGTAVVLTVWSWYSAGQTATLALDDSNEGMDLLADNTMDGLDAPPELPGEAGGGKPQPAASTPQLPMQPSTAMLYSQPRSVFPGMQIRQCWLRIKAQQYSVFQNCVWMCSAAVVKSQLHCVTGKGES